MQRQQQINDHKRIASFSKLLKENPKDIRLAEALLSACANATAKDDGSYETKTVEAEYAFKKGMEVYNSCLFNVANARDIDDKRKWLVLTKSSLLFLAHKYFDSFLLYLEFDRRPDKRFYAPRKNQLKKIVDGYQDIADGKLDLLTVSMPKRCGKSQLGSILFSIWRAGMYPDKSILLTGQGDQLVKSFYDGCLEIMQDRATYNYWDVFPGATIANTNAELKSIDLNSKKRFPTITCRSIDGKLTGATEASNFLSIDDPVSGFEEANNYARLDLLWNKIRGDVLGRRKEGVPIIIIGTRYSIHDPIGHLQEMGKQLGWRVKIVEVPALDPVTDESNFRYKYGLGFSTEYYRNERKLTLESQWASEFQQQPIETRGAIFQKDTLQYYMELPQGIEPDAILSVTDTALGGGDFTSMPVGYIYGEDVYIEDVVYNSALPTVVVPEIAQKCKKHKISINQVESNNQGLMIAEHIEKELQVIGAHTSIRTKLTTANKQTKILTQSDYIKKHFFFKHESMYEAGSEYGAAMREMWSYSQLAKNNHDDFCDSCSQLSIFVQTIVGCKVTAFKRPF